MNDIIFGIHTSHSFCLHIASSTLAMDHEWQMVQLYTYILYSKVDNRFPEAPEVRAAYATFLAARGEDTKARQKFLEIPDRQRLKFADKDYLTKTISWPPAMIDTLAKVTSDVGDS